MDVFEVAVVFTLAGLLAACGSTPRSTTPEKIIEKKVVADQFGYSKNKSEASFKCKFLSLEPKYGNDASRSFRGNNSPVLNIGFQQGIAGHITITLNQSYAGGSISSWRVRDENLETTGLFISEHKSMGFISTKKTDNSFYLSNVSYKPDSFRAHAFSQFLNQRIDTLEINKVDSSTFKGTLELTKRTKGTLTEEKVGEQVVNAEIECDIPEIDWLQVMERVENEYKE